MENYPIELLMTPSLIRQMQKNFARLRSVGDAKEVAIDIYETTGQKDREIARRMVENVQKILETHSARTACGEERGEWVKRRLDVLVEGEGDPVARCRIYNRALTLLRVSAGLCGDRMEKSEATAVLTACERFAPTPEDAPACEARLRKALEELLRDLRCPMPDLSSVWETAGMPADAKRIPIEEIDPEALKLLLTVQIYANRINGAYPEDAVPPLDILAGEIGAAVDYGTLDLTEAAWRRTVREQLTELVLSFALVALTAFAAGVLLWLLTAFIGGVMGVAAFLYCIGGLLLWDEMEEGAIANLLTTAAKKLWEGVRRLPALILFGMKKAFGALFVRAEKSHADAVSEGGKIWFNKNEELIRVLETRTAEYLQRVKDGEETDQVLCDLWMREGGLNEEAAADKVKAMRAYRERYLADKKAIEVDREGWIRKILDEQVQFMDEVEKCKLYRRILITLRACELQKTVAPEELSRVMEDLEASMEKEFSAADAEAHGEALRDEVYARLLDADLFSGEVEELLFLFEDAEGAEVQALHDYTATGEQMQLLLGSMACIMAKNGAFEELDGKTSERDILYAVGAGVDVAAVAMDVRRGDADHRAVETTLLTVAYLTFAGAIVGTFVGGLFASVALTGALGFLGLSLGLSATMLVAAAILFFGDAFGENILERIGALGARVDGRLSRAASARRERREEKRREREAPVDLDPDVARIFFGSTSERQVRPTVGGTALLRNLVVKKEKA